MSTKTVTMKWTGILCRFVFIGILLLLLDTFNVLYEGIDSVGAANVCTNLANWQCVETRPGLSLCRANNTCTIKVDLNNNSIRPKVAVAPNGGTAWLSSIASSANAYAAINGDYFSGCPDSSSPLNCGEGLTYINGTDYTDYSGSEWQNRRSLGFNDNYDPNIGLPGEQGGYHRQLLGGGPQVTFGGEFRWRCWYQGSNTEGNCSCQNNTVVINDELFGCSANNWWGRPQTFIGFSDDRNTLYLTVSEPGLNKTPREMHDVLWVQGARYTLKMDGGGSSGMYYNDGGYQFSWNGGREVANAWVIVPNNDPPPPPECNPNSDQAALFVDPNYSGSCVVRGMGEYPNPGAIGIANDSVSSIKVGANVKLTICQHDNFINCETFEGDDPNLSDNGIGDNQVSSAKVESRGGPCTNGATYAPLQPGYNFCANEGGTCNFNGQASVAYGANNCFFYRTFTSSVGCNNDVFGDPISGTGKACYSTILAVPSRPFSDFDGDGDTDVAIYRPSQGMWYVRNQFITKYGIAGDIPVSGDYNGDGITDVAIYRRSQGMWYVRNQFNLKWGVAGDIPMPGDYDGDGDTDLAIYRPSQGMWYVKSQFNIRYGLAGDIPVPGDYDGDGDMDLAIYRPSQGMWYVRNQFISKYGIAGDIPVPGDYDGDGDTDVAIYRPSQGMWYVKDQYSIKYGIAGDVPVPGDYDGDGDTDVAIYRRSQGMWYVRNQFFMKYGLSTDFPLPVRDTNGDGDPYQ